jgi:hypothetical protein
VERTTIAEETEVLGENLPQRHFVPPRIPHDQVRFRTPDRSGGKPATNRLSYGAAQKETLLFGFKFPRHGVLITGISGPSHYSWDHNQLRFIIIIMEMICKIWCVLSVLNVAFVLKFYPRILLIKWFIFQTQTSILITRVFRSMHLIIILLFSYKKVMLFLQQAAEANIVLWEAEAPTVSKQPAHLPACSVVAKPNTLHVQLTRVQQPFLFC